MNGQPARISSIKMIVPGPSVPGSHRRLSPCYDPAGVIDGNSTFRGGRQDSSTQPGAHEFSGVRKSNPTTWRLAKMNLAIRGTEGDLGDEPADSFHRDLHKDLKADYILANPSFNMSE